MIDMSNIEALPSGHFRLRMQVNGKPLRGTFATLEEAIAVRDAAKREIADEHMVIVEGQTLSQSERAFFRTREGNRGVETEKQRWRSHLATAAFAHRALPTITRRDIIDWLDELKGKLTSHRWGARAKKPLGWQTRKHCLNLLRSFFNWALERELVATNPATGVVVAREDGDEDDGYQETWFLDVEEQTRFLASWDAFDTARERAEKWIAAVAIGTGIRQGEQWCLHLADVHLEGPDPHIVIRYGSWDAKKKRYRSPKGRRGEKKTRIVPLFGLALDAFKRWVDVLPTYAPKNPLGLAFPTQRGARRGKSKNPRTWDKALERFGVVARIGRAPWWHLLRHTCASSLVAGWWGRRWSLEDVRMILGHSSVKVTERYAHFASSVVHAIATEAQAAWGSSSHGVATNPQMAEGNARIPRPSKPNVVSSNLTGRASTYVDPRGNAVATAAALLERVAAGESVTTREWVDAVCDLIAEVQKSAVVAEVASTTKPSRRRSR